MKTRNVLEKIPGPPARFGRFAETVKVFNDPIRYFDEHFKTYGPIFVAWTTSLTTPPSRDYPGTICIFGPNLIRELCSNHDGYHRSALSHRLYPVNKVTDRTEPLTRIMTGLTHVRGDTHRAHRRLILPAFHKQRVKTYLPDIISETNRLMDEWSVGETYDMMHEMSKLILRISARSLFGQTDQAHGEKIGLFIDQWVDFIMSLSHLFPFDVPGFPYRSWLSLSSQIEEATRRMIVQKRAHSADDDSLLSMLIQATNEDGSGFTEEDLVGHISLMLWGSRDAAAAALMWTTFLISLHADVQACIVGELENLGGSPHSLNHLEQLSNTENAIKESMRLMPPFPVVNRVASPNGHLGGYEVPNNTEVIMSIYHTHRMPELYPEPDAFRPERWEVLDPSTFEYMPFGGGPRMCPGFNLAWQELLVATGMLWQRFRFEVVEGTKVDRVVKLGMLPTQSLPMKVLKQDGEYSRSVKHVRGNVNEMVSTLP